MIVLALLALVVAVALSALCALMLLQLQSLRRHADQLSHQVAILQPAAPIAPDLERVFESGTRRVIVVEILNPVELATEKVKAAALLGAMRPELLRKIVNEQAVRTVREQLVLEGVQADVSIHAVR